jgi:hypothetical protein
MIMRTEMEDRLTGPDVYQGFNRSLRSHAVEFPDADSDLRDRAIVPELRIAAAGHRFRP